MFCLNCGAELPDTAKFCNECGMKIEPKKQVKPVETPVQENSVKEAEKPKMTFQSDEEEEETPKKNQFVLTGKPKKPLPIMEEPEEDDEDEDEDEKLEVNTDILNFPEEEDEDEDEEDEEDSAPATEEDEDDEEEDEDEEEEEQPVSPPTRRLSTVKATVPAPENKRLSNTGKNNFAADTSLSASYSIEDDAYWNDVLPEIDDEINQIPKDIILKAVGCVVALFVIIAWLIFML